MSDTAHAQLRAVQRHDAILRAARELMIREGMSAVTHRQVADAAEVPLSSIRYYFSTREDLLQACMRQIMGERDTEARHVLAQAHPGVSAEEAAHLFLRAFYGPDLGDTMLLGIVGMVVDCARATPELSRLLQDQRVIIEEDFTALLIKCGQPHVPVTLIAAVIDGSLLNAAALRHENLADIATNELAALLT